MTLGSIGVIFGHYFRYQNSTEQANKTEQMAFLFCSTKTDEANRTEHNPLGLFCFVRSDVGCFALFWCKAVVS
jgi:hypothetical protein